MQKLSTFFISIEKLFNKYDASPYSLYPLRGGTKQINTIRTSLKTFQGKNKLGYNIIRLHELSY